MCLFTNCTRLNLTMFTIQPDSGITKIAETVLVSAICGFLPICCVIRLGLEPRPPTLKVLSLQGIQKARLRLSFLMLPTELSNLTV